MAVNYCTQQIVKDGLVFYLDAANTKSYPSSGGSTWYDLSGNKNNATLYNTPTFDSSLGGGVITFNGSDEYGLVSTLNFTSSDHTIMAIAKYNTSGGRVISAYANNWLMGWHGGYIDRFYAGSWIVQSSSSSSTDFYCYAATGDISGDTWKLYKNGSLSVSNSNGLIGPNQISLGRWSSHPNTEYSNCSIGIVMAYNRVLTAAEITQNFNAHRGRYGI